MYIIFTYCQELKFIVVKSVTSGVRKPMVEPEPHLLVVVLWYLGSSVWLFRLCAAHMHAGELWSEGPNPDSLYLPHYASQLGVGSTWIKGLLLPYVKC